jgi:nitrite reductase/ring-hydroxylating ferredoxin subunit
MLVPLGEPGGAARVVTAEDGRRFAVFPIDGGSRVTDAECPHNCGPPAPGRVDRRTIVCPWRRYRFGLDSGACATSPSVLRVGGTRFADVSEKSPLLTPGPNACARTPEAGDPGTVLRGISWITVDRIRDRDGRWQGGGRLAYRAYSSRPTTPGDLPCEAAGEGKDSQRPSRREHETPLEERAMDGRRVVPAVRAA